MSDVCSFQNILRSFTIGVLLNHRGLQDIFPIPWNCRRNCSESAQSEFK